MNISPGLGILFNAQYNAELTNAFVYRQLQNAADILTWDGFAKFLKKSSADELEHAQKIADFLIDRNKTPSVDSASRQVPVLGGSQSPFVWIQSALRLEESNTTLILELYKQCEIERDIDACIFLHWFITEQRKSERELFDLLQRLTLAGDDYAGVKLIDADVGK